MENTNKTKKTIIEEALIDFDAILKEAGKSARDKFVSENADKFDKILNEEIKKLTNKSDKEPLIEGKTKELSTDNKSETINEEVDLTSESIGDVEDVYNNAKQEDEFEFNEEVGNNEINFQDIEQELLAMDQGVAPEMDAAPHNDDLGGMPPSSDQLPPEEQTAGITAADTTSDMGEPELEVGVEETHDLTDPFAQMKSLYEQMGKIFNDMEEKEKQKEYMQEFENHMSDVFGSDHKIEEEQYNSLYEMFEAKKKGDPFGSTKLHENESEPFDNPDKKDDLVTPYDETDEKNIREMKEVGGLSGPDQNKGNKNDAGGPTQSTINEEDVEIEIKSDDEGEEEEKEAIDEIHGQSYSAGKVNAARLPNDGAEYRDRAGHSRERPQWSNEAEKKIKKLLGDKQKLSKKMNEYRDAFAKTQKLVEQYKGGLKKYRTHIQEMAIFNTNLAHVNNILVESVEDKENVKGIINKFKNIGNIEESKKVYKTVISEMKNNNKEVISEQVEAKLNKEVIGESSSVTANDDKSKIITESAYKNDAHLNKLKGLIKYTLSK